MAIATVFVGLRFWARTTSSTASLAYDDWFLLGALAFAYGTGVCCILGGAYGIGKHIWAVDENDVLMSMKIIFAYVILYATTVPMVKLSVLLLYRRIFQLTWTLYFCAFLSIGYAISVSTAISLACVPTSFFWTQWVYPLSGGHCRINLYEFYLWNGVANLFTDVIILCLPMPIVWGLQMPRGQKLAISGIFLLGGFVCVATIVRIWTITKMKSSVDITWVIGDAMIWSNVEPCVGIVSACLPTLRPLLRRIPQLGLSSNSAHYLAKNDSSATPENSLPESISASANRSANRGAVGKKGQFRPAEDEIYLTTDVGRASSLGQLEGASARSGGSSHSRGEEIPMQIKVNYGFHWSEEHE
ncbi:hypothetical protein ASPWEDRAFT_50858 [Aspergillus wentii DTO 134E9]|uniref:Rhodopsin domain-containing protein n=1 Tax=Aspergillus wentii DTO 134E9 TaxID=1073089 RepID=A0A1L9RS86_ASPWE|nr:uncharacterized protein ASPWEDRAFT_50858 [Aspergillus wentii DTO 134E9]OJJ37785.1 hypothetical protein ASPWEDRAFT_50858 [Aspergillus wentii DTO 134E9]